MDSGLDCSFRDHKRVGGALAPRFLRAAHLGAAFVALPLGLARRRDEHERDAGDLVRVDHAPAARRPLVGWVGLGLGFGLGSGPGLGLGLGSGLGPTPTPTPTPTPYPYP